MANEERDIQDSDEKAVPVSFGIRLTDKQRKLLARAAKTKGWSVTALLKSAALEKAAFIVNTKAPSHINFKELARTVATQIFEEREVFRLGEVPNERTPLRVVEDLWAEVAAHYDERDAADDAVEVSPGQVSPSFLVELREAARFGGTEFLEQVVQASQDIVSRSGGKLQSPVDPITGE